MMMTKSLFCLAFVALLGCRSKGPPKRPPDVPALLGTRSEATTDHFVKTCPTGDVQGLETTYVLDCQLGGQSRYVISFDDRSRVRDIELWGLSDVAAREHFDRAIAPILPPETRDVVSRSLQPGVTGGWKRIYMSGPIAEDGSILFKVVQFRGDPAPMISWALYGVP
jgi:hypothetical protein